MTRPQHNQRSPETDQEADQELLLLAHGALPFWTRLRVQAHLRRCADCRARLFQLSQTSARLADAVRGPDLPAWSRPQAMSRAAPPLFKGLILAVLAALTLLILTAAFFLAKANLAPAPPPAAPYSTPSASGGCRPDLPNSRCR